MLIVSLVLLAAVLGTVLFPGRRPDVAENGQESAAGPLIPPRPEFADVEGSDSSRGRIAELRDESFDIVERLVQDLPNSAHAFCLLATIHRRHANEGVAVPLLERALAIDPSCADAYHSFGLMALNEGDYATAEKHLRRAFQLDPAWDQVPLPLTQAMVRRGKFREAVPILDLYLQRNPDCTEGWCRLAQAYQQLEDFGNARRCNLQAIATDPDSADAHYGLAMASKKLGKDDEAQKYLERFEHLRSETRKGFLEERSAASDEGWMRITVVNMATMAGEIYAMDDDLAEAERCWRRAAELDPEHCESRVLLGRVISQQGRFAEALGIQEELCELQPVEVEHWLRLGRLHIHAGEATAAETPFRRAIELAPERADGYAALAQVRMLPGQNHRESLDLAQKAVELASTAENHFVLAGAYWKLRDWPGAEAALKKAMSLDPSDPRYQEAFAKLQREKQK